MLSDDERMTEVNAQLAKADAKAIGIAQVAGVMLAIGATRPELSYAVWLWGAALLAALLALTPRLGGDHGIVAWAKGREGAEEKNAVRRMSALAVFKYRCIQASGFCLYASVLPVLAIA